MHHAVRHEEVIRRELIFQNMSFRLLEGEREQDFLQKPAKLNILFEGFAALSFSASSLSLSGSRAFQNAGKVKV